MNCAGMSGLTLDLVELAMMLIGWIPAIAAGLFVFSYTDRRASRLYPGKDNENRRKLSGAIGKILAVIVFGVVLTVMLESPLAKKFVCVFA